MKKQKKLYLKKLNIAKLDANKIIVGGSRDSCITYQIELCEPTLFTRPSAAAVASLNHESCKPVPTF